MKDLRKNERIRIRQVRVIDETGAHLGIIETADALKIAIDKGLDLVEVSPESAPPVCKIMHYSKYKYEQHKKEQKAKKLHHQSRLKELRLRPVSEEHDIQVRLNQAKGFLKKGNRVLFNLFFKGREISHKELGYKLLERIKRELKDVSKIDKPVTKEGYRLTLVLSPNSASTGGEQPR
ncbi:MAG: translation initiation factor IF-3 [Planctomycetota bacterium]|nr:translation initiation factor IF-3 [Planctomycetota bacterium]MDI6788143.1 translation initiation factor IF-3 [Planctomycetota bacterium]